MVFGIKKYEIELTNKCNALCIGCPRTNKEGTGKHPGLVLRDTSLEEFKSMFPPELCDRGAFNFCGLSGDPLASKDFLKIIMYIREHNPKWIGITTNGSLGSKMTWETLAKMNSEDDPNFKMHMNFSVDGTEETNHIYRVNVKWKKVERNMLIWNKYSIPNHATWKFIDFGYNFNDIPTIKRRCRELNFNFSLVLSCRDETKGYKPGTLNG